MSEEEIKTEETVEDGGVQLPEVTEEEKASE